MNQFAARPGETHRLDCAVLTGDLARQAQPAGYPKVSIVLIQGGTTTPIITDVPMTQDVVGEWYYDWVVPATTGQYKVRYTASIDGADAFGYDVVDVQSTSITYSGVGLGDNRYGQEVDLISTLEFQLYKNNIAFDAFEVSVKVYTSWNDALNDLNPVRAVAAASVNRTAVGRYSYAVTPALVNAGTYYDVIKVVPYVGEQPLYFIQSFFMRRTTLGPIVPGIETANITFYVFDAIATAQLGDLFYVELNVPSARYNNVLVPHQQEVFTVDNTGLVTMALIETTTLTSSTGKDVYYTIYDRNKQFVRKFKVPAGTGSADLFELPTV